MKKKSNKKHINKEKKKKVSKVSKRKVSKVSKKKTKNISSKNNSALFKQSGGNIIIESVDNNLWRINLEITNETLKVGDNLRLKYTEDSEIIKEVIIEIKDIEYTEKKIIVASKQEKKITVWLKQKVPKNLFNFTPSWNITITKVEILDLSTKNLNIKKYVDKYNKFLKIVTDKNITLTKDPFDVFLHLFNILINNPITENDISEYIEEIKDTSKDTYNNLKGQLPTLGITHFLILGKSNQLEPSVFLFNLYDDKYIKDSSEVSEKIKHIYKFILHNQPDNQHDNQPSRQHDLQNCQDEPCDSLVLPLSNWQSKFIIDLDLESDIKPDIIEPGYYLIIKESSHYRYKVKHKQQYMNQVNTLKPIPLLTYFEGIHLVHIINQHVIKGIDIIYIPIHKSFYDKFNNLMPVENTDYDTLINKEIEIYEEDSQGVHKSKIPDFLQITVKGKIKKYLRDNNIKLWNPPYINEDIVNEDTVNEEELNNLLTDMGLTDMDLEQNKGALDILKEIQSKAIEKVKKKREQKEQEAQKAQKAQNL